RAKARTASSPAGAMYWSRCARSKRWARRKCARRRGESASHSGADLPFVADAHELHALIVRLGEPLLTIRNRDRVAHHAEVIDLRAVALDRQLADVDVELERADAREVARERSPQPLDVARFVGPVRIGSIEVVRSGQGEERIGIARLHRLL